MLQTCIMRLWCLLPPFSSLLGPNPFSWVSDYYPLFIDEHIVRPFSVANLTKLGLDTICEFGVVKSPTIFPISSLIIQLAAYKIATDLILVL
jgi:hypothetical protein